MRRYPRDLESIPLQLDQFRLGYPSTVRHFLHVLSYIGSEVGRVIRIDGDLDAISKQTDNLLALEIFWSPQNWKSGNTSGQCSSA